MKFEDLLKMYEEKKKKHGVDTYKHISELLKEAKVLHKKDWQKKLTLPGAKKMVEKKYKAIILLLNALKEYEKYRVIQDRDFISDFDREVKKLLDKSNKRK